MQGICGKGAAVPKGEFAEYGQSNDEERIQGGESATEDAKARRRAERAAHRAQRGRQDTRRRQESAGWDGLPYSDALLQEGLDHARAIAEKRIKGKPRSADDWLNNDAEVKLALLAKAGRLARECLIEAHLDAAYAATKGYKRLFEAHDLGAEYHHAVRLAVEDSIDKFDLSEAHVLNSWVSTNKKPVERRLCECYAQKTALRSEHEARKYFAIVKAYRKLEDSLQETRKPTESELLESLDAHTATQGMGRETMLDILDRGSDGVHKVVFSTATSRGDEERTSSRHAAVVPTAKLAAGTASSAGIVDAACATNPASSTTLESTVGAAGSASCATEAHSGSTTSSAPSTGKTVTNDPEALIFRNGIEQDMTPVERAVYRARIAPVIDAEARPKSLAKTAEEIRISCGLPMMQADRIRRIELRLRERFVLGGELGVYSGAETSTWLRQERSRLHSDYWLLDLLALRLAEMLPKYSSAPKAKNGKGTALKEQVGGVTRDECYSMLLPVAVKTDDLSGKNGNGRAKALWENKKLSEDAARKEGRLREYEDYLADPLAIVRGRVIAKVPNEALHGEDPWAALLWHFFFDEATDIEVEEFATALKDALIHDASAIGASEYTASTARAYTVKRLLAAAAARDDGWACKLEHALCLMLCWMLDIERADDESMALAQEGLLTGGGAAPSPAKPKAGQMLAFDAFIVDGVVRNALEEGRELHVHPWLRPRVGIGHAFEKNKPRKLGHRREELAGEEAWGVMNLPGQQECLAGGAEGRAQDPVSREHALLLYAGSESQGSARGWLVFDLASSNGTLIVRSNADGSVSNVVVGFGTNNCTDAQALSFGPSCADGNRLLRETAKRAGAAIQVQGARVMPGDTLVFGFAVREDPNGVVSFGARNGALCLRVREA